MRSDDEFELSYPEGKDANDSRCCADLSFTYVGCMMITVPTASWEESHKEWSKGNQSV